MFGGLRGLIRKEFIQVFRDRNMLRIIFAMPIIQLFLFGYVANTEVKEVLLDVYDFDQSAETREYIQSFAAGGYFVPQETSVSIHEIEERFKDGSAEIALIIPPDFTKRFTAGEGVRVGMVADGSNASNAAIALGYAGQISSQYSRGAGRTEVPLDVKYQILYNPEMESVYFMVPGIVAALLTMVTVMLTSMGIVREREGGTLEQLLVTPMTTVTLILGKLIPFAVLGIFEMVVALTVGILWFGVPFAGSVPLLFALSGLYLISTLGIGLLFSTVTSTQQQAMFFAWFFSIFALLTSGLLTPIENMPQWTQQVTYLNPMRYFMDIARGILMRGAGFAELQQEIIALTIYGPAVLMVAVLRFSKRAS